MTTASSGYESSRRPTSCRSPGIRSSGRPGTSPRPEPPSHCVAESGLSPGIATMSRRPASRWLTFRRSSARRPLAWSPRGSLRCHSRMRSTSSPLRMPWRPTSSPTAPITGWSGHGGRWRGWRRPRSLLRSRHGCRRGPGHRQRGRGPRRSAPPRRRGIGLGDDPSGRRGRSPSRIDLSWTVRDTVIGGAVVDDGSRTVSVPRGS